LKINTTNTNGDLTHQLALQGAAYAELDSRVLVENLVTEELVLN